MRSIWSGAVAFGLVNVPVKVYSATESHDVEFKQVHNTDAGKIRYKRVCEDCGEVVEFADIAKAFVHADGRTAVITADDLASIPAEQDRQIEVLHFVPASDIDPIMFEKSYYLAPDGKSAKAYVLLARTLAASDQVAIVQFSMRSKTRLAALRVKNINGRNIMVVHTLLWDDEVRQPEFTKVDMDVEVTPAELQVAAQVVASMAGAFDPAAYTDVYQTQLRQLVDAKLDGVEAFDGVVDIDGVGAAEVSDLLAMLTASVKGKVTA